MLQQITGNTGFSESQRVESFSDICLHIPSRNSHRRFSLLLAGLLALLTGFPTGLLAQTADPVQSQPTLEPWLAKVTGKSVNLRAGASTNHFAFSRLTMDAPVIAMGGKGDWVEIVVPSDQAIWIHGDFVEEAGEGRLRVTGDRVRLRCTASTNHTPLGLTVMGQILKATGQRKADSKVAGKEWVEVFAPLNARGWIHGDYVKRSDQKIDPARLSTLHDTLKTKPGSPSGIPPVPENNTSSDASVNSPEDKGAAQAKNPAKEDPATEDQSGTIKIPTFESERLKQLFEQFQKETEKPPVKWDFSDIFRKIQVFETTSEDLGEIRVVKDLARTINEHFVPLQRRLIEIERQQEIARAKREKEQAREKEILRRTGHRNTPGDSKYQAVGWVVPLGKHRKVEASHKLMKGNQLLFYLNGKDLNLDQYVNKRVGIVGTIKEQDPELGARLLEVQKIEILSR